MSIASASSGRIRTSKALRKPAFSKASFHQDAPSTSALRMGSGAGPALVRGTVARGRGGGGEPGRAAARGARRAVAAGVAGVRRGGAVARDPRAAGAGGARAPAGPLPPRVADADRAAPEPIRSAL